MTLQPKGLPPTHLINLPAHAIILLVNLFQKAALMLHPQSSSATHKGGKKKRGWPPLLPQDTIKTRHGLLTQVFSGCSSHLPVTLSPPFPPCLYVGWSSEENR